MKNITEYTLAYDATSHSYLLWKVWQENNQGVERQVVGVYTTRTDGNVALDAARYQSMMAKAA